MRFLMLIVVALSGLLWGGCDGDLITETEDAAPRASIHQQRMDDWAAAFSGRYQMISQSFTDGIGISDGWFLQGTPGQEGERSVMLLANWWLDVVPKGESGSEYHTLTISRDPFFPPRQKPIEYMLLAVDRNQRRLTLLSLNYPPPPWFGFDHGQSPVFHMVVMGYTWNAESRTLTMTASTGFGGVIATRWRRWQ